MMQMLIGRKANVPALALFVLAILISVIVVTHMPDVKQTVLDIIQAIVGKT